MNPIFVVMNPRVQFAKITFAIMIVPNCMISISEIQIKLARIGNKDAVVSCCSVEVLEKDMLKTQQLKDMPNTKKLSKIKL